MDDIIENRTHVFNTIKLITKTGILGSYMIDNIAFNLVVSFLPKSYTEFIINFLKDYMGEIHRSCKS